jgi:hypothetical protein
MTSARHLGEIRLTRSVFACAAAVLLVCCSAPAQQPSSGKKTPAQPPTMSAPPAVTPPAEPPTPAPPPTPSLMPDVPGTPIDRIVAIVNDDLILDSDVNEEMRFEAFDPYRNPTHPATRDDIIERLINRALILQQLKLQPGDAPSDADVTKQINQLRKNIPACNAFHCETTQGWDRFLGEHGFTQDSFFKRWKQRMTVLNFIEERFQMGINITKPQIQSYYEQTLLPEYKRLNAPAPRLQSISTEIREILVQQQISSLLQDWLQSLRAQGSVVVLHPGQEAP